MKGLICYFSTTGNTKLACELIAKQIKNASFSLLDITCKPLPDLDSYQVIGFAAFADFLAPSVLMANFIKSLPLQKQKPAFVFDTYGNLNGKTLHILKREAEKRGFNVIAGHALQTPENYPPLVAGGLSNAEFPNQRQLDAFNRFIAELDWKILDSVAGKKISKYKISAGLLDRIIIPVPRRISRKTMGEIHIDASLCNNCGICREVCPYGVIGLNPDPVFDRVKCYSCWSCYNHCPSKAVYTKKLRLAGHYPGPNEQLRAKLRQ